MPQYNILPDDLQSEEAADAFRTLFGEEELRNVLNPGESEEDNSGDTTEDGKKTWSREEWEEAAGRTAQMDEEEFEDWDTAKEEGRVND